MQKCYFLWVVVLFFVGCMEPDMPTNKTNKNLLEQKALLLEQDRAFAKACKETGMQKAFIDFADSNVVLLTPGKLPLVAGNAIGAIKDWEEGSTLTWEPKGVEISENNDMGVTYGVYTMLPANSKVPLNGTYAYVWKKQKNGRWKYLLSTANAGIEEDIENNTDLN
jgi:ketosteroid isomerase-like protein